jgi:predicted transcriptional regulator
VFRVVTCCYRIVQPSASMAATSLKLPDELKRRIERLAAAARTTPHAFMVEALTREVERSELRERFRADAAQAEKEVRASGRAFDLPATFGYLATRISGRKARRPRARAWRASK